MSVEHLAINQLLGTFNLAYPILMLAALVASSHCRNVGVKLSCFKKITSGEISNTAA